MTRIASSPLLEAARADARLIGGIQTVPGVARYTNVLHVAARDATLVASPDAETDVGKPLATRGRSAKLPGSSAQQAYDAVPSAASSRFSMRSATSISA